MKYFAMSSALIGLGWVVVSACGVEVPGAQTDELGSYEEPLVGASGQPVCGGKKVLICHIPPGNPANAHTICVGEPAVKAHQKNHSDTLGACAKTPPGTGGSGGTGGGTGSGGGTGGSGGGQGDACRPAGAHCGNLEFTCCGGSYCVEGTCVPQID